MSQLALRKRVTLYSICNIGVIHFCVTCDVSKLFVLSTHEMFQTKWSETDLVYHLIDPLIATCSTWDFSLIENSM